MRKLLHKVHLWLGLVIGLVITILCLSGAVLVFQDELSDIFMPKRQFARPTLPNQARLPMAELIARVQKQEGGNPVTSVSIPADTTRTYVMSLKRGSRVQVYVNPYTAEVTGRTQRGVGFFNFMVRLHRWLLGQRDSVGQAITGYATLGFVIILISGLVIWWPKSRTQLRSRLEIKTKASRKRMWYDLHVSLGFYLTLGLLVLALTGLYFSFGWYRDGLNSLLGVGKSREGRQAPLEKRDRAKETDSTSVITVDTWQIAVDDVRKRYPESTLTVKAGEVSASLNHTWGNYRASDTFLFDQSSGTITGSKLYADQPYAGKVRGWIYSLHTGKWGGLFSKTITFLISLLGATLPITGLYIYLIKRPKKRKKAPQTRSVA